ncbi:MAG TPA: threonine/serine dehydratase [Acidimicrobiia bacterium]
MDAPEVTPGDIDAAASRIDGFVRRTPVLELGRILSDGYSLTLKLEHLQVTGSFKPRGAFSVLTATDIPPVGVVAASGGNFGIAVSYAASRLGHDATVFVPKTSPSEKIDRIGEFGAHVRVIPGYYDEARTASEEHAAETGAFQAHAYDHPEVVAGQGTLAREIEMQVPVDVVLCAVGGGGLIGGIASWFRQRTQVVAVEPELCRSFNAAVEAGHPVEVEVSGVASSSLGARAIGRNPWRARAWIDRSVLVSDDEIIDAQRWLWMETKLAVEPAAAAPLAALLTGRFQPEAGANVVVVLSGANVDLASVA